jgi:hypothetical protein
MGKIAGNITGKKVARFALALVALAAIAFLASTIADAQTASQFADNTPLMYAGIRG